MNVRYEDYNRPRFNLDESLVLTWANNIKEYFEDTFKESVSDDIDIILSPRNEYHIFGDLDEDEINHQLKELREKYLRKIEENPLLSNARWHIEGLTGEEGKSLLSDKEHIDGIVRDFPVLKPLIKEVRGIFAREKKVVTISGLFTYPKTVYIFYNVFHSTDEMDNLCGCRNTLAHELLHAFHFQKVGKSFNENDFIPKVVKEALADYFSYCYCYNDKYFNLDNVQGNKSIRICEKRLYWWQREAYSSLPYPYARFLQYDNDSLKWINSYVEIYNGGFINKMIDVFILSKTDMIDAYKAFVPEDWKRDNEEIGLTKGIVIRRPVRRSKPSTSTTLRGDGTCTLIDIKFKQKNNTYSFKTYSYWIDDARADAIKVGDEFVCKIEGKEKAIKVMGIRKNEPCDYEKDDSIKSTYKDGTVDKVKEIN